MNSSAQIDSMRIQLQEHCEDWLKKKRLPHYLSWEKLRAISIEIIFGLLACPVEIVPDTAPYLGEVLMWIFLNQSKSDCEQCMGKKPNHQMWHLLQKLDDEKLIGHKAHEWVRSNIHPCKSMSEVINQAQKLTKDTNVALMAVITAIVFPAGVRHLRSALTEKSDLPGHVPILLRSMEHMHWTDGRLCITEVDAMLTQYAKWIQHFKACKKRKGNIYLRRANLVWHEEEIDESPPAKKRRSVVASEKSINELCDVINSKRQALIDVMENLAHRCEDTGEEVCALNAKDAVGDVNFAVDGLLRSAQVGRQPL